MRIQFSLAVIMILTVLLIGCSQVEEVNTTVIAGSDNQSAETMDSAQPTPGQQGDPSAEGDLQELILTAEDGIKISANYIPGSKGVVLLHMLGTSKEDWNKFMLNLHEAGYASIAIDMRGHGESMEDTDGRELTYTRFGAQEMNAMAKDAAAAVDYLVEQGITDITVMGASIGANIAYNTAIRDKRVNRMVLLSPGLNYRGVVARTNVAPTEAPYTPPMFAVASEDDFYSFDSTRQIVDAYKGEKKIIEYDEAGHGVNMFTERGLDDSIIAWISS